MKKQQDLNDVNAVEHGSHLSNYEGKTVVVHKSFYKPEYRSGDRRFAASGGFGCDPTKMGRAVFGKLFMDGAAAECIRVDRVYIEGVAVNQK